MQLMAPQIGWSTQVPVLLGTVPLLHLARADRLFTNAVGLQVTASLLQGLTEFTVCVVLGESVANTGG